MNPWDKKKESGFEDDPRKSSLPCRHPEHDPPGHMVIPRGKIYRHVCPSCGMELVLRPPEVMMKA
jgi:hypothetical protein